MAFQADAGEFDSRSPLQYQSLSIRIDLIVRRCSSVGRAPDRKSGRRRFDPFRRHHHWPRGPRFAEGSGSLATGMLATTKQWPRHAQERNLQPSTTRSRNDETKEPGPAKPLRRGGQIQEGRQARQDRKGLAARSPDGNAARVFGRVARQQAFNLYDASSILAGPTKRSINYQYVR